MTFKFRHILCFATLLVAAVTAPAQTVHRRLTGLLNEPDGKHSRAVSFDFTCQAVDQANNNAILKSMPASPATVHMESPTYTGFKGTCTTSFPLVDGNKGVTYIIHDGNQGTADISFTISPVKYRPDGTFMGATVLRMTDGTDIRLQQAYQKPDETIWVGTYSKMVHEKEVVTGKIVLHERKNVPAMPTPPTPKPKAPPAAVPPPFPAAIPNPAPAPSSVPAPKPALIPSVSLPIPDTVYAYRPLYRFNTSGLKVSVWDNYHVDGEVVRLKYGTATEDIKLTADKQGFTYYIPTAKVAALTLTMINEGSDPGNTVSIIFSDGGKEYSFEVNGHAGQSFTYYFWHQ